MNPSKSYYFAFLPPNAITVIICINALYKLTHLILTKTQWNRSYYSHFTYKKLNQEGWLTRTRSQSYYEAELGSVSMQTGSRLALTVSHACSLPQSWCDRPAQCLTPSKSLKMFISFWTWWWSDDNTCKCSWGLLHHLLTSFPCYTDSVERDLVCIVYYPPYYVNRISGISEKTRKDQIIFTSS